MLGASASAWGAELPATNAGDTAWMLVATALVLFMTLPGLAFFYGGLVRSKNALSILMQCFAITCLTTLVWFICGYGFAFGDGGAAQAWLGSGHWFMADVTRESVVGTIPETVFAMFQMTFAIITPALVIGGVAERMRFSAVIAFSILWLLAVYLPVCHWVWGGGWLAKLGLLDFAGGTVVHINAGVGAVVAALVLGNRRGFPHTAMPPHNMTLTVAGAAMLWVGWFGFNAGSAVAANGNAGMAMLVTHLSAASGSVAWMAIEWYRYGKPSVLGIVTGMVAGLGTITPASGYVGPAGAIAIGLAAGFICYTATHMIKRVLIIDDSLDVFPVHGVGGIIGTLAAGVFAARELGGVGFAGETTMLHQVGIQTLGVLATLAWCAALTFAILKAIDATIGLRVAADEETEGLDLADHGERAYIL
ncbi:MAG: ammonium transporter [Gammaproteobacteria bacterium]|nr:ammonium transporter [Gammaproteobacteria bacterium]MBI5615404.1 ammonium transporter [Gammaproteobacteria bacterium]